ncbi:B3/B4 domain-containing protein [Actinokineospora enzanensis]|uniref:B3/B4 domain-containing protein n=1 Tax=Actinokineospora enzanensis TaxID=155975 RepID=UPI000379B5E7|nr:phenylalanine--tRNA ligase beta subunit-related protein [Actinokineospora enzanensis]
MRLRHSDELWQDFPELVPGVLHAEGITPTADVTDQVRAYQARAAERLAERTEAELPEVRAWRRAFARMGLKPTQYRCASESLLRRFRKEGGLPSIHPLIDLCNAASLASAIPIAVFDADAITGDLRVCRATGDETYLTFAGATERPEPGEVIFVDDAGHAHARRWTNRQSGRSAVRASTRTALIVTEGQHPDARTDVRDLVAVLAEDVAAVWTTDPVTGLLDRAAPVFAI